MLTSRRPAFPYIGAVAFGLAIGIASHLAPAGHPVQPDPILLVPVALLGILTGRLLLDGGFHWRMLAGATTALTGVALMASGARPSSLMLVVPLIALTALAWVPEPAPACTQRSTPERAMTLAATHRAPTPPSPEAEALVLGGRWALRTGPPPGADRGGFSLVHLAEDLRHPGRLAVVKLPNPNHREQARSRLAREQEMLRRIRSPYVI